MDRKKRFQEFIVKVVILLVVQIIGSIVTYILTAQKAINASSLVIIQNGITIVVTAWLIFYWEKLSIEIESRTDEASHKLSSSTKKISDDIEELRKNVTRTINEENNRVLQEISENARVLKIHGDIRDSELRGILNRLLDELDDLIDEAKLKRRVGLKLDDLFEVAKEMMKKATSIRAIDIEVNRWETDNRGINYFRANKEAISRGAIIKRIYVVNPHTTLDGFSDLLEVVDKHQKLNDDKCPGKIELRLIYFDDIPEDCKYKDFAIFEGSDIPEGKKVIYETFDKKWRSTFKGSFTKNFSDVKDYEEYFASAWEEAQPIDIDQQWTKWCASIRKRIKIAHPLKPIEDSVNGGKK